MKTKRTILTSVLLLVCIIAFSQVQLVYETDNHMKFMGIPMKGDINTFAGEFVKQGFPIKTSGLNLVIIRAEIIGKQCEIVIVGTKKTKTVYQVSIMLPTGTDWQSMKADYMKLKKQYIVTYGTGISKEFFQEPYTEGDGREMEAIVSGKVSYTTYWKIDSGTIMLDISDSKVLYMAYLDKTNAVIDNNEKLE